MRKLTWAERRFRQNRVDKIERQVNANEERLASAAIIRLEHCHAGFKSHAAVRQSLGDKDIYQPKLDDKEGFLTSRGRFVTRDEAVGVGIRAGQIPPSWAHTSRKLLSSDINW